MKRTTGQPRELCRDLVGKSVRLRFDVETVGGEKFTANEVLTVQSTWRGRYELTKPAPAEANVCVRSIRRVRRSSFDLVQA